MTLEFRGHTIAKTGAVGPGPGAAGRRSRSSTGSTTTTLDPSTELGAHTVLEAQKLAYADRDAYFGDARVPLETLLSPAYAAERRALIGETRVG